MPKPLITGVHALMLGVREFEPMLKIFRDALEWDVVSRCNLPAHLCQHLWKTDAAAEVMVLASRGVDSGRVHLVRFADLKLHEIDERDPRSFGFRAMNTYVRDMGEARARIESAGGSWGAETHFDIVSTDGTKQTVHQGRAILPDGAGLVFVIPHIPRWTAAWELDETVFSPEATSVVVASPDADASRRFWGPDGLGHEIRYDVAQANPGTNKMVGLPDDAVVRVVFTWGERTARVEILGRADDPYSEIASVDIAPLQRPGISLGPVGWTICVDDMGVAITRMTSLGGQVIAAPVEANNDLHRGSLVATVETPEGTWLNVWQR
jgi:hypothetical protein